MPLSFPDFCTWIAGCRISIEPFPYDLFDTIESLEAFEHDKKADKVVRDQKYIVNGEVLVIKRSERGMVAHTDICHGELREICLPSSRKRRRREHRIFLKEGQF